jgi:tRNA pseudouridine synthase 10
MNQPPKSKVFLEGRYRKLVRDLPQTVFYCPECKGHPRRRRKCQRCEGYGKLTRESVQELVGWVAGKAFKTRKNRFHGAGREDIDVRMLGTGRPFILELVGPKNLSVDLAEIEAEINRRNEGRLEIKGLHWTEKSRVQVIKETAHAKEYAALVETAQPVERARIDEILSGRIEVTQRTPDRVAHRRADKQRVRWVEFLSFEPDAELPDAWAVRLRTQHGTYVKEVLSGEGGRTEPSLSSLLGVPCQCRHLDVLAILDAEGEEEEPEYVAPPVFGRGLDDEER